MAIALTENSRTNAQLEPWNFWHLGCAFVIGFILQQIFLACLCNIGQAKTTFALVIDALVGVRVLIAYIIRERGRGWIFYTVLLYTSPGWIAVLSRIVLGPDGW